MNGAKQMVEGFAFLGDPFNKALLERGEEFNVRVSAKDAGLADYAKREKPRCGECFMNAQKFVISHPDAKYYEGYWAGGGFPVHHGWVVLDGKVVDFTAEDCDRKFAREFGEERDTTGSGYFGVHIPTPFMVKAVVAFELWTGLLPAYLTYLKTGEEPVKVKKVKGKPRRKKKGVA